MNNSTIWVKLLEGPRKGADVKRTFKQFRLEGEPPATTTVPAAGSKRPLDVGPAVPDKKAKETEAAEKKALAFFCKFTDA